MAVDGIRIASAVDSYGKSNGYQTNAVNFKGEENAPEKPAKHSHTLLALVGLAAIGLAGIALHKSSKTGKSVEEMSKLVKNEKTVTNKSEQVVADVIKQGKKETDNIAAGIKNPVETNVSQVTPTSTNTPTDIIIHNPDGKTVDGIVSGREFRGHISEDGKTVQFVTPEGTYFTSNHPQGAPEALIQAGNMGSKEAQASRHGDRLKQINQEIRETSTPRVKERRQEMEDAFANRDANKAELTASYNKVKNERKNGTPHHNDGMKKAITEDLTVLRDKLVAEEAAKESTELVNGMRYQVTRGESGKITKVVNLDDADRELKPKQFAKFEKALDQAKCKVKTPPTVPVIQETVTPVGDNNLTSAVREAIEEAQIPTKESTLKVKAYGKTSHYSVTYYPTTGNIAEIRGAKGKPLDREKHLELFNNVERQIALKIA